MSSNKAIIHIEHNNNNNNNITMATYRRLLSLAAVATWTWAAVHQPQQALANDKEEEQFSVLLPRAHVINLQQRPERLKRFKNRLRAIGIGDDNDDVSSLDYS